MESVRKRGSITDANVGLQEYLPDSMEIPGMFKLLKSIVVFPRDFAVCLKKGRKKLAAASNILLELFHFPMKHWKGL